MLKWILRSRSNGVHGKPRPPLMRELFEGQHRSRVILATRSIERIAMGAAVLRPVPYRCCSHLVAIVEQDGGQRVKRVLPREPPKQLEVLGERQVFAVSTESLEAFGTDHGCSVSDAHLASLKPAA